jgi:subtilisin family serine protease
MVATSSPELPPIIYAEASVRSQGGVSLFETTAAITQDNVPNFYSDRPLIEAAVQQLTQQGFQVQQVSPTTLTIAAPAETYQQVFRTRIVAEERPVIKKFGVETTATFLDSPDTALSGLIDPSRSPLADVLEGIAINEPVYYFASLLPPAQSYWHLAVPGDVSLGLNADLAHRAGYTGKGVRLVMVDSGWYRHPFFIQRGYRANTAELGPAADNPDHDEHGHGTGESANIFAIAPDVEFTMVKINFVNVIGAFNRAIALKPDIISCSWGSSQENPPLSAADRALEAAIARAVRQGIIVVVSAGNGHWGFPGQHPDVISAGGAYLHPDGSLEATPYASGFASKIYPSRNVPDVCGLVGLPPRAQYIMLPVEPGNELDSELSGGTYPEGDQTDAGDGWAAFSGTSAAAPQIAGACALLKQAKPGLSPVQAREILQKTARDVTAGTASPSTGGNPATAGPDLATGYGLVDVFRAVSVALSAP